MKTVLITLIVFVLAIGLTLLPMAFFPAINYRDMPEGLSEGNLPPQKPNWVSSHADSQDAHYIKPLAIDNLKALAACLQQQALVDKQVTLTENQLLAYKQTKGLHFTDWLAIDSMGNVSASATMGYSDLGQNRKWVEAIREVCGAH